MLLYHATSHKEPLQEIQPHNNVTVGGARGAFVFATEDLLGAHCYALKTPEMRAAFSLGALFAAVIENREKFFDEKPTGRIYPINPAGFQQVYAFGEPTEEWISPNPIAVNPDRAMHIDFEKALAAHAQFFFIESGKEEDCMNVLRRCDHTDAFQRLGELLYAGIISYENERLGLQTFARPLSPDYVPSSW